MTTDDWQDTADGFVARDEAVDARPAIFPTYDVGQDFLTEHGARELARLAEERMRKTFPGREFIAILGGATSSDWDWELHHGSRLPTEEEAAHASRICEDLYETYDPSWWITVPDYA